ncbi:MAG: TolC family protein [Hyphomicrobiales bacterium]
MKILFIFLLWSLIVPVQSVHAQTISLNQMIEQGLRNSPEVARVFNTMVEQKSTALEVETLDNPSAEINFTGIEDDASRSISIEIEQPLRRSNFGARQSYADALRHTANAYQKAQSLEIIHSMTRSYISYWVLQEQEKLLSQKADYARKKQELIERAAKEGRMDVADAKIFKAEVLRLEENLRVLRAKKIKGTANLLRMAGMDQQAFKALRPKTPAIPELQLLSNLSGKEGGIRNLLESRKNLAEKRYQVAKQDAGFPEFSPRAVIERDFDEDSAAILFGVNIAIPIWNRNNAELARANAELRLSQSNLNALSEQNFVNVLAASYEQTIATQASVTKYYNEILPAWEEVQSIMDKKFNNGQASILDLFQMRERITNVQNESLQTYIDSVEARIELESLIGQSLTDIKE